jgi:hypothetical protein
MIVEKTETETEREISEGVAGLSDGCELRSEVKRDILTE